MGKTKFSVDRKTFEELSLTESKLKSSTDFFDKKNLSSQERLFYLGVFLIFIGVVILCVT